MPLLKVPGYLKVNDDRQSIRALRSDDLALGLREIEKMIFAI